MAAKLALKLHIRKRWFFWPAMVTIVTLGRLGILRDMEAAGAWLARYAMVLKTSTGRRIDLNWDDDKVSA